jgi:hypothetical protein
MPYAPDPIAEKSWENPNRISGDFRICLFWSPKTKPIRKTLANPSVANIENIAELATAFRIQ